MASLRTCVARKRVAQSFFLRWYWEAFDTDIQLALRQILDADPEEGALLQRGGGPTPRSPLDVGGVAPMTVLRALAASAGLRSKGVAGLTPGLSPGLSPGLFSGLGRGQSPMLQPDFGAAGLSAGLEQDQADFSFDLSAAEQQRGMRAGGGAGRSAGGAVLPDREYLTRHDYLMEQEAQHEYLVYPEGGYAAGFSAS